jgi:hypothetical protein
MDFELNSNYVRKGCLLFFVFYIVSTSLAFSQSNSLKQYYRDYYLHGEKYPGVNKSTKELFDPFIFSKLDQLKAQSIDTFGVFLFDRIGLDEVDSCQDSLEYKLAFVQWVKNGVVYHQRITPKCEGVVKIINYSVLISYYINCRRTIDPEFIFPAIMGATNGKNGELIPLAEYDIPDYEILYCNLSGHSKYVSISVSVIMTDHGDFNKDNINSTSYSWCKITRNQLSEFEKW